MVRLDRTIRINTMSRAMVRSGRTMTTVDGEVESFNRLMLAPRRRG
jgi:hypothetical protein